MKYTTSKLFEEALKEMKEECSPCLFKNWTKTITLQQIRNEIEQRYNQLQKQEGVDAHSPNRYFLLELCTMIDALQVRSNLKEFDKLFEEVREE